MELLLIILALCGLSFIFGFVAAGALLSGRQR
jgi:hypothetical protein